jgi:hypothetical protein
MMQEKAWARHKFIIESERFLLGLVYYLNGKTGSRVVHRISMHQIMRAEPKNLESIYLDLIRNFGIVKANGKMNLDLFCFNGKSSEQKLTCTFLQMCIAICNCIWRFEENMLGSILYENYLSCNGSAVELLCDILRGQTDGKEYVFFGKDLDGNPIPTCRLMPLFAEIIDIPAIKNLPKELKDQLDRLPDLRADMEGTRKETKSKSISLNPSSRMRYFFHVLIASLGVLFGTFSVVMFKRNAISFIRGFVFPKLNAVRTFALGITSGLIACSLIAIFFIRILCTAKCQAELQNVLDSNDCSLFKRILYKTLGARRNPNELSQTTQDSRQSIVL